jgi:pSer/pThr/pTyr-binding forkhead associated (FHA) protein
MAKLILSMDGLVLKEIPLTKERTTIGRKPHNDIQIDNLAVSGEHAVIVTILNDSFLEDLGSTNGTVVNGNPIKKHFLQNNDVVELGKYKLKFIGDAAPAAAGEKADFEKTMVLRPSQMKAAAEQAKAASAMPGGGAQAAVAQRAAAVQQAAASAAATGIADKDAVKEKPAPAPAAPAPVAAASNPAPAAAPAPSAAPAAAPAAASAAAAQAAPATAPKPGGHPLGAIQLLSGANAGKELELTKPLTTLGKPGVQVAVLTRRPQGYFITHVEGASRPTVNGQAIGAAPHSLKDHDVIELAGVKMEFFLKV